MDIRNKKIFLNSNMKHFALKATASAILTLNVETVIADSCPHYINAESNLAGMICDYNTGTLPKELSKLGTMSSGRVISSETINGGISNGGFISTTNTSISINKSEINGGISNSGTINSTGSSGIKIFDASTINGGISNSGLISAHAASLSISKSEVNGGIFNSGTINSNGPALFLQTSTINGSISNSGLITTHGIGFSIKKSEVNGSIFNSRTINSTASSGIKIFMTSTINGGIYNSGTIISSIKDAGIAILGKSVITKDITNSGFIYATGSGNGIALALATIGGGITNSGTIKSAANPGLALHNVSSIGGDIFNSGTISGLQNGINVISGSTVSGGIFNSGIISSSNGGIISESKSGALLLRGTSTVSGGISNSGTISGPNIGISIYTSARIGGISNDGIISGSHKAISISTSATISGALSNGGIISGGHSGISVFSRGTISGGISNSGTIQGDIYAIKITDSNVSDIDILGQSARIIGKVKAVDTDVHVTHGAIFTSEDSYHVKTFNIDSGALFNMGGKITAETVNNSGVLALTDLQTIKGKYKQHQGGIFQTEVSSATNYGKLSVTKKVNLKKSGTIYVKLKQNTSLHSGDILYNIISGDTVKEPTNGLHVSDNSFIWTFSPTLNNSLQALYASSNGINLTATINPNAYTVCQGAYCQEAVTAIIGQVATGNPIFSPYATLATAKALRKAVSQATPELTNENIQMVQLITRSVLDIAPMWSTLHGKSSGDAMIYQPGKIWLKPYGASMTQNERHSVDGFNAAAYGAVIGRDIQLNDWLFGGAFAAGGDNMRGKSALSGQSINSTVYQGMVYGSKKFSNHLYFAGQGLVGYGQNNTNRSMPIYVSTAKGSYNSWYTNIRAEAGWSIYAFGPNFVFTPEVDASYLFVNQGGYQESGSPMDLLVASNNNSSLILGAYGNGAYHVTTINNKQDLTLTGYVGIAGDVINSQPQITSTFVTSGSRFSTFGVPFNELVFRGGVGLALSNQTKPLSIELNYDLQAGNNAYSGTGAATIKYKV